MYGSRVPFVLSRYCCLEPDLSFVTTERLTMMEAEYGCGAPDIVIEFVSPCSRTPDYVQKRVIYEETGVQEYWIIDPPQRRCQFLRLTERQFTEMPLDEGQFFHSEVLPGFRLNVEWLFTEPLPRPAACLRWMRVGNSDQ